MFSGRDNSITWHPQWMFAFMRENVYYTRLPLLLQSQLNVNSKWLNVSYKFSVQLIWFVEMWIKKCLCKFAPSFSSDSPRNVWNIRAIKTEMQSSTALQALKLGRIKYNQIFCLYSTIFETDMSPLRQITIFDYTMKIAEMHRYMKYF